MSVWSTDHHIFTEHTPNFKIQNQQVRSILSIPV